MNKTKNNSLNKDFYTQRNNELKPEGACNVTAMINALSAAGWPVEKLATEKYSQPEDALMNFILTDNAIAVAWKRLDPARNYPPNEWHPLLAKGANLYLKKCGLLADGEDAVFFSESRPWSDIIDVIDNGGAAICTGTFTTATKKAIGHVIAIVGYEKNDQGIITNFIVDDSWGDYRDGYKTKNGNDVKMPVEDFLCLMRPRNLFSKIMHVVKKYEK